MKIEEARKMKAELEESIESQIRDFTSATGLAIMDISLAYRHQHYRMDGNNIVDLSYGIEMEVRV